MSKVTIDPESREDVLQLIYASDYLTHLLNEEPAEASGPNGHSNVVLGIQAGLREFNKGRIMKEPQGIGAVVVDIYGERWVRASTGKRPWLRVDSDGEEWSKFSSRHVVDVYDEGTMKL